jgi:hypothetical protein
MGKAGANSIRAVQRATATSPDQASLDRDMDDTLEHPKHSPNLNISSERNEDNEQDASDGEDGGLDWTKLPYVPPSAPTSFLVMIDLRYLA